MSSRRQYVGENRGAKLFAIVSAIPLLCVFGCVYNVLLFESLIFSHYLPFISYLAAHDEI